MTETALIISDLHFSDKPIDDFMWSLFPQVEEQLKKHKINRLIVLGDITENKSGFTGEFVNKIVDGFVGWAELAHVDILAGNHDGITASTPFLAFLGHFPNVAFYTQPICFKIGTRIVQWLPHTRNPKEDWKGIDLKDKVVFFHLTVDGALSEANQKLQNSVDNSYFMEAAYALGGDVHTPGKVGYVEYIGSPYATKFFAGNNHRYRGMILNFDTLETQNIYFDFPKRLTLDVSSLQEFHEKTAQVTLPAQVKMRLHVTVDNYQSWKPLKTEMRQSLSQQGFQDAGWDLVNEFKDTHKTTLIRNKAEYIDFGGYVRLNNIDDELAAFGQQILNEASA